jgi:hypothetical protein
MKKQLPMVFHQNTLAQAPDMLAEWLAWACRSRIPAFVKLSRTIRRHRDGIHAALVNRLSNARVESANTNIRLITRRAFGFRSPEALTALAMLSWVDCAHPCPDGATLAARQSPHSQRRSPPVASPPARPPANMIGRPIRPETHAQTSPARLSVTRPPTGGQPTGAGLCWPHRDDHRHGA